MSLIYETEVDTFPKGVSMRVMLLIFDIFLG
jgi:hypothetical protein